MMSGDFSPGEFVVVLPGALIVRVGGEEGHYADLGLGVIIGKSYQWHEPGDATSDGTIIADFMVLLNKECMLYYVPADKLTKVDGYTNPARLFTRLSG